jgi:hypothetical protein
MNFIIIICFGNVNSFEFIKTKYYNHIMVRNEEKKNKFGLNDTDPEIDNVQIQLLRKLSNAQRLKKARELSHGVLKLSKRALRRSNPDLSDLELKILFVSLNYGKELAEGVRQKLAENSKP